MREAGEVVGSENLAVLREYSIRGVSSESGVAGSGTGVPGVTSKRLLKYPPSEGAPGQLRA